MAKLNPDVLCSFVECGKPLYCKGLCRGHYTQRQFGKELAPLRQYQPTDGHCSVDGCSSPIRTRRLCDLHYQRVSLHGDPGPVDRVRVRRKREDGVLYSRGERARFYAYGITPEQFEAMLAAQGGRCLGCLTTNPPKDRGDGWHVDHCHTGGHVRMILCRACNIILGQAHEDGDRLRRLAKLADEANQLRLA